jgi:hypothetical protein
VARGDHQLGVAKNIAEARSVLFLCVWSDF